MDQAWPRVSSRSVDRFFTKFLSGTEKHFWGNYRLYKQDHSRGRRLTTTGQPTVSLLPLKSPQTGETAGFRHRLGARKLLFTKSGPPAAVWPSRETIQLTFIWTQQIDFFQESRRTLGELQTGPALPQTLAGVRPCPSGSAPIWHE